MRLLDLFLEILRDGEWHDLTETARILGVNGVKMGMVAAFLNHYGFIELEELKAKLTEPMYQFLKQINWIQRAEKEM